MDVRQDDFWRWCTDVEVGSRKVWMRTLSASDDNERTKMSMQASRVLRVKLLTEGSPEREDMLLAYNAATREELLATLHSYHIEMSMSMAMSEVQPKMDPPKPDEKTLDAAMDAEEEWAAEMVRVQDRRQKYIEEQVATLMARHEEEGPDELRDTATEVQVSLFSSNAYGQEFNYQTLYRACFKDKKFTRRTFPKAGWLPNVTMPCSCLRSNGRS